MNTLTAHGIDELARLRGARQVRVTECPPCQACGARREGLVHVWTDLALDPRVRFEAAVERMRPIGVWIRHTAAEVVDPHECSACEARQRGARARQARRVAIFVMAAVAALASALAGTAIWWGR